MPRNILLSDSTEGEGVIITTNKDGIEKSYPLFIEMRVNDFRGDTILFLRYKRKYTRLKIAIRNNIMIDINDRELENCSIKPSRVVMFEKTCPAPMNFLNTEGYLFPIANTMSLFWFFNNIDELQ